jgi:hypothetical protein
MKESNRYRRQRAASMAVDYTIKTTMPIRDMWQDGEAVFVVDIYGWSGRDLCVVPGGADPMLKAVQRLGLDPYRYQAILWDVIL